MICIYRVRFVGFYLEKKQQKSLFPNPTFHKEMGISLLLFWHERSSCCLSAKPGEIGC